MKGNKKREAQCGFNLIGICQLCGDRTISELKQQVCIMLFCQYVNKNVHYIASSNYLVIFGLNVIVVLTHFYLAINCTHPLYLLLITVTFTTQIFLLISGAS